jgi:hypothetical protein
VAVAVRVFTVEAGQPEMVELVVVYQEQSEEHQVAVAVAEAAVAAAQLHLQVVLVDISSPAWLWRKFYMPQATRS